jgi:hypothetical protein
MFLLLGIRRKAQRLATVFAVCVSCHTPAAQAVTRVRTFFTVFFIPLIPLGSKYRTTCTMCGQSVSITKETADHLVVGAQAQAAAANQVPGPPPPGFPPPPAVSPPGFSPGIAPTPPSELQGPWN